jgi:hypothetical protein
VDGDRDAQCNDGFVGVRCELCDYENGYAIHQPGNKCSKCTPNEGRNSVYLSVASLFGLLLLLLATKMQLWPQWLSRVRRVVILKGSHAGDAGKLVGSDDEVDMLNGALRAVATLQAPPEPPSAFELFRRKKLPHWRRNLSETDIQGTWEVEWQRGKQKYELLAREQKEHYEAKLADYTRTKIALKTTYVLVLKKDAENKHPVHTTVRGMDLRLCTLNIQDAYQVRVTKIKITVRASKVELMNRSNT